MDQDLEAIRRARLQELQSQSPDGDNNNSQQKEEQKYVNPPLQTSTAPFHHLLTTVP